MATIEGDMSGPSGETQIDMFRKMMLIKLCDERLIEVIRAGQLRSPYYSPRGQEAISAAVSVNLRPEDYVVTTYRGLHDHLAKGVPLKPLLAASADRDARPCQRK